MPIHTEVEFRINGCSTGENLAPQGWPEFNRMAEWGTQVADCNGRADRNVGSGRGGAPPLFADVDLVVEPQVRELVGGFQAEADSAGLADQPVEVQGIGAEDGMLGLIQQHGQ